MPTAGIAAAMAIVEERRRPEPCAGLQSSPAPGENKFSAQRSAGWSKPYVHRPVLGDLHSAAGCCGSIHHPESRGEDAGDESSESPATGRHRADRPWLRWERMPFGIGIMFVD